MEVKFSKDFRKQYKKSPVKIRAAFDRRLKLFLKNPIHPYLRNHQLKGILSYYRSINITGDWRALYIEYFKKRGKKIIIFETIGTHSQLYQ